MQIGAKMIGSFITCKGLVALALGVAIVGFAPTPALAQAAKTDLTFCNKTGAKIFIAVVYQDPTNGKWILSAWSNRDPGKCESFGAVKSGLFYYFAEKEGRQSHWPSADSVEKTYCVPAERVKREMAGSACTPGERSLGFKGRVTDPGKYTFTFS